MSIAEKLTNIAQNQYKVYEAGKRSMVDPNKIIEKTVTGTAICVNDVSEIPHKCTVSVDKDASITVCGKNILDYRKATGRNTEQTVIIIDNGVQWVSGNYYFKIPCNVKAGQTVTFSCADYSKLSGCRLGDDRVSPIILTDMINFNDVATSFIATIDTTVIYIYKRDVTNAITEPIIITNIQLEIGDIATEYEPYKSETHTITAGETIEVESICPTMSLFADNDASITFGYHQSSAVVQCKQAEYDRFWDTYQKRGKRTSYNYAFYSWDKSLFNPKYDIDATQGAHYTFYYTDIEAVQKAIIAKGPVMLSTFANSPNLHTIAKLIVSEATTYNNTFGNATALENITFEGVIGSTISFASCSKLTDASVQSIIDHLKDLTGQTAQTLTFHATVGGNLAEGQKAAIAARNWTLIF